jgi:hypothetical protein
MTTRPRPAESDTSLPPTLEEDLRNVALVTRVIYRVVDVLLINSVAIITGLGAGLSPRSFRSPRI